VVLTGGTLTSSVHDGFFVSSTTFPGSLIWGSCSFRCHCFALRSGWWGLERAGRVLVGC